MEIAAAATAAVRHHDWPKKIPAPAITNTAVAAMQKMTARLRVPLSPIIFEKTHEPSGQVMPACKSNSLALWPM